MIKDTNPDHYKVDGANFIEFMNDPKLSGFGSWMFANGYNSGVWASTNWISVKDRLPKTGGLALVYGSAGAMTVARYIAGNDWVVPGLFSIITHWMPLPEPPKEDYNG
jgi:hypothetical protein